MSVSETKCRQIVKLKVRMNDECEWWVWMISSNDQCVERWKLCFNTFKVESILGQCYTGDSGGLGAIKWYL